MGGGVERQLLTTSSAGGGGGQGGYHPGAGPTRGPGPHFLECPMNNGCVFSPCLVPSP